MTNSGPAVREHPGPWQRKETLPMQAETKPPRRVRVERGIYKNPGTGRFEIQYTDSAGKVRWQTVAGGIRDARFARAEIQSRLGRGDLIVRADRTVREVGEEWLAAQHHLRARTAQLYETACVKHIDPPLGQMRIGSVTTDHIARFVLDLQRAGLSGSTASGVLMVLGRIFSYAARRGLISENPVSRLERGERPRVRRREMRILSREEIDLLLRNVTSTYQEVIATAVFTGLRQGELLGLTWADVDFANGVLHVRCQLDRSGVRTEPKTVHAYRQVLLMPSLAALLRRHKMASGFSAPTDPVFATLTGRPMNYRNVTRRGFSAAVTKAGLDRPGEPRLRFHDLRHTFASLLVAQGLNVVFISRQLGHASSSFTLDVYSHLFDRAEHAKRAADYLEADFGEMLTNAHFVPSTALIHEQARRA
jgi:integrase